MPRPDDTGTLQAVDRALRILRLLADAPRPRTLQELSQQIGCSPSTVHRMLATLARHQLVEKDPDTRRFGLGLGLLGLADARVRHLDLYRLARPHLETLSERCRETVSVYVVRDLAMTCIDRIDSPQEVRRAVEVGEPVRATDLGATGKVYLASLPPERRAAVLDGLPWAERGLDRARLEAELDGIAARGVARSHGERVPGASALAAAVWDHRERVAAALVISGPSNRLTEAEMDRWEGALRCAADALSQALGSRRASA